MAHKLSDYNQFDFFTIAFVGAFVCGIIGLLAHLRVNFDSQLVVAVDNQINILVQELLDLSISLFVVFEVLEEGQQVENESVEGAVVFLDGDWQVDDLLLEFEQVRQRAHVVFLLHHGGELVFEVLGQGWLALGHRIAELLGVEIRIQLVLLLLIFQSDKVHD